TTLLAAMDASASEPNDCPRQWPVLGYCGSGPKAAAPEDERPVQCAGAFALPLDESVYRIATRADLGDVAAFNGDDQPLAFGPMPSSYDPPPAAWRDSPWFALPSPDPGVPADLHLHITRSTTGDLSLDATLRHGSEETISDYLVDVRAPDRTIEAIEFGLTLEAPDFSSQVRVQASDDLQSWRTIVDAATIAHLRQGGQSLLRRQIEFAPTSARYLRLQIVDGARGLPLRGVRLLLQPATAAREIHQRSRIAGEFVRRDGKAFVYRLPARVPVERVNIELGDDNAIAAFSISAREVDARDWIYIGQLTAFRLRGAGVQLDNEAMPISGTRMLEWRIETSVDLVRTPILEIDYRPETWLLLTHGKPPYKVAAGSSTQRRQDFPLDALVGQVRAKYGRDWTPTEATLGAMQTAGGEAALTAFDPEKKRAWMLWAVLLIAALAIIAMVVRLLGSPRD
ncbi:MAG: DUF3999 family protein, partial [Gammaproteobacteria bacterium]|nr:DUF3999 family protein [Gammaproteobacteria bacterium]